MSQSNPKLTIGMATFRDFNGVYFTVQSLRMYHLPFLRDKGLDPEIIIVDNDPQKGTDSQMLKALCQKTRSRYIHYPDIQGTAAPRNKVFEEANGDYVLCLDSHVLLVPGALTSLVSYYESNPDTKDLIQGPLVYDDMGYGSISTHFSDVWRSEMWGIWDKDDRGLNPDNPPFEIFAQGLGLFSCRGDVWLSLGGFNPNFRAFGGEECYIHEKFRQAGHKTLCIPALRWVHRFGRPQGVHYRLTRQDKVRNYIIGHRELGLNLSRVYQHFVKDIKNPMTDQEWNLILASVDNPGSFAIPDTLTSSIGGARISRHAVPILPNPNPNNPTNPNINNPLSNLTLLSQTDPHMPKREPKRGCQCAASGYQDIEEWYTKSATIASDINEHIPSLRTLAEETKEYGNGIIVEYGTRYGVSTSALMAAKPKLLISVDVNESKEIAELHRLCPEETTFVSAKADSRYIAKDDQFPDQCDLLFIDSKHTADHVWTELSNSSQKVKGRIAFHDTVIFGEAGEDGGPGLLPAIRRFLKENPQWSVLSHARNNHGFLVISNLDQDKKKLPGIAKQVWNFTKAVAKHVTSGSKIVPLEIAQSRLDECAICESRTNDRCGECGCYLNHNEKTNAPGKVWWAEQGCPLGKWHAYEFPSEVTDGESPNTNQKRQNNGSKE